METVVFIIMLLVCFNFTLKQTYAKNIQLISTTIICALCIAFSWPLAIEQSKTQIADWLNNTGLMLDTSVLLSIDVILQMAFCMLAAHLYSKENVSKKTLCIYRLLKWFPGVLIFPVLFSMLVGVIFTFPGNSFSLIAGLFALVIVMSIPLLRYLLLLIIPEKDLRTELLFLSNALTMILGIIATVNGKTAAVGKSEIDWGALGGLIIIIMAGAFVGMIIRFYRLKKQIKNSFQN